MYMMEGKQKKNAILFLQEKKRTSFRKATRHNWQQVPRDCRVSLFYNVTVNKNRQREGT